MLMELGICLTVKNGPLYVWAYVLLQEVTFVHVGYNSNIQQSSGELCKEACSKEYPGLWQAIENKISAHTEVDDGI